MTCMKKFSFRQHRASEIDLHLKPEEIHRFFRISRTVALKTVKKILKNLAKLSSRN